jgi:hypothetical protein
MKLRALGNHALEMGIDEDVVDEAEDAVALIDMIMAAAVAGKPPAAATPAAIPAKAVAHFGAAAHSAAAPKDFLRGKKAMLSYLPPTNVFCIAT